MTRTVWNLDVESETSIERAASRFEI